MAENIEWGACPVCGGRVTGKIDSWRSGDRLHVDQPCDEPPVCGNGCPLEDFAPRISFVVKCGDGEPAKEVVNYRDDERRGLDVGVVPATLP